MIADFTPQTMEARRQGNVVFKILNEEKSSHVFL